MRNVILNKMQFSESFLFKLFVLFLPLEQLLYYSIGVDTILKPYRVFIIFYVVIIFFKRKSPKINKYFLSFSVIFLYGLFIAIFRLILGDGNLTYLINGSIHFMFGLIILYSYNHFIQYGKVKELVPYFLIGVFLSTTFGYYDFFSSGLFRLRGFFNNPNHLAFAINFASLIPTRKLIKSNSTIIDVLLLFFFTVTIILAGSRTGLFIHLILLLYLLLYLPKIKKLTFILVVFIISVFVPKPDIGELNVLNRYKKENYKDASGRNDIRKAALKLGKDTYFLGVGIQQYRFYHLSYLDNDSYSILSDYELSTHNHFLDLLVNFGFLSFIIFIIILSKVIIKLWKLNRYSRSFTLLVFIMFLLVCSSQEMFMFPLFWLILAIAQGPLNSQRNVTPSSFYNYSNI